MDDVLKRFIYQKNGWRLPQKQKYTGKAALICITGNREDIIMIDTIALIKWKKNQLIRQNPMNKKLIIKYEIKNG